MRQQSCWGFYGFSRGHEPDEKAGNGPGGAGTEPKLCIHILAIHTRFCYKWLLAKPFLRIVNGGCHQ
jgi:hypothetical protein